MNFVDGMITGMAGDAVRAGGEDVCVHKVGGDGSELEKEKDKEGGGV